MKNPISLDEVMSRRAPSIVSTPRGEAISKVLKAPPSWDEEKRTARFTMTAQVVDRYRDIVVTSGIETGHFEKNPVALFNHDHDRIVGTWSDLQKTERGRKPHMDGTVQFLDEGFSATADEAVRLVMAGALKGASIGFMPIEYEWIRDEDDDYTGGIKFTASELIECSVVAVPANPAALVKSAGGNNKLALAALEYVLDEWARTPDGLIVPREEYERTYSVVKLSVPRPKTADEAELSPSLAKRVEKMIADAMAKAFPAAAPVELDAAAADETAAPADADAEIEVDEPAPPAADAEPTAPEAKSATPEEIAAARLRIAALEADLALDDVD
jgi:HK97 family phage prohead protease